MDITKINTGRVEAFIIRTTVAKTTGIIMLVMIIFETRITHDCFRRKMVHGYQSST